LPSTVVQPLDCFAYLAAPNAPLYSEILRVFADARTEFRLNLRASEVVAGSQLSTGRLSASEAEFALALDQLCQWGNLESFNDQSQASSLEEFYKRHLYYQLSGHGVAALRAIELFHEIIERPASLQSTGLSAVLDRLRELIVLAKQQETNEAIVFDVGKASSLLDVLFNELEELTAQAQEFFRGLQATVELRDISIGAFLSFKERLVHYLQRFLNQVVVVSGDAEQLLATVDPMLIDAMLDSVARHRTIDEMDVTDERIDAMLQGLKKRWQGVERWFIAGTEATSQADELRSLARSGIREVAAAASRIQRSSSGAMDRSSDYRRLAVAFAECADDRAAHRLWRSAFCLAPARHFIVSDETLAERDQEPVDASTSWHDSPPLRIAPTIRKSGRVARAGKPRKLVDNRDALKELKEQSAQESAALTAAREELLVDQKRLSELPQLSEAAFPILLDLLGEALSHRGKPEDVVSSLSTDGSMEIRLRRVEDGGMCYLETSDGTFEGPDFWVSIESVN